MWVATTATRKLLCEINCSIKVQASIVVDVDVQGLEVRRGVNEADLASLHEVVRDRDVLLVGRNLDIVRSDSGLVLVGIV